MLLLHDVLDRKHFWDWDENLRDVPLSQPRMIVELPEVNADVGVGVEEFDQ